MPLQNRMIQSTKREVVTLDSHYFYLVPNGYRYDKNLNANRQRSEPIEEKSMLVCLSNTMMMIQVYRHKFLIRCRHSAISPPLETPS